MRLLMVLMLFIAMTGCATVKGSLIGNSPDEVAQIQKEYREKRERDEARWRADNPEYVRQQEEAARREKEKENVEPGWTMDQVKEVWGEPASQEFDQGKYIHWYDDPKTPRFFIYDSKKRLLSSLIDRETIEKRERADDKQREEWKEQKRQDAENRREKKRALAEALRRAGENISNSSRSVNCTSSRTGDTTFTHCN